MGRQGIPRMAKSSIYLTPLSSGHGEPEGDNADAQFVLKRVAANQSDKKRLRDEALRYRTAEANTGASNAGIIDPEKFPKRKEPVKESSAIDTLLEAWSNEARDAALQARRAAAPKKKPQPKVVKTFRDEKTGDEVADREDGSQVRLHKDGSATIKHADGREETGRPDEKKELAAKKAAEHKATAAAKKKEVEAKRAEKIRRNTKTVGQATEEIASRGRRAMKAR